MTHTHKCNRMGIAYDSLCHSVIENVSATKEDCERSYWQKINPHKNTCCSRTCWTGQKHECVWQNAQIHLQAGPSFRWQKQCPEYNTLLWLHQYGEVHGKWPPSFCLWKFLFKKTHLNKNVLLAILFFFLFVFNHPSAIQRLKEQQC